ncbi:unnamed protein product [Cuscuta campestris]|uniref:DUF4219 domain-containing protein n=1 Tax=Cuscuta campestris TaxID=132261 RepID=A0A484MIY7_9ASTE|nr:unnamed protein product [Cuscuta campestris]
MGSSSRNLYAGIGEGQSTSRPPLFDGTNYCYWKERIRIYIRSTNFQLWLVIKNDEEIPMKKVGETTVPKTENEFDAEDIKKIENYAKAINMLYCTDQVREAKIDFLTQEYEMFRMKEGEKIDDMFDRFSKIINDFHALKKTYTNVTIDGLRGNLKTYESIILTPSLDEQKKKGIALKATKKPVEDVSSDDDNEFGLVIKKFHKFMKKEFERKGRKHDGPPKCYGCGEGVQKPNTTRISPTSRSKGLTSLGVAIPMTNQPTKRRTKLQIFASRHTKIKTTTSKRYVPFLPTLILLKKCKKHFMNFMKNFLALLKQINP